jgi:hypothetical protein
MFWTREESRATAGFPNPYRPARSLVILRLCYPRPVPMIWYKLPTTLFRLHNRDLIWSLMYVWHTRYTAEQHEGISYTYIAISQRKIQEYLTKMQANQIRPSWLIHMYQSWQVTGRYNYKRLFLKVLKKAMHSRLSQHLHTNNILVTEQYGFKVGISTEDAAFRLTDNVHKSINQKPQFFFCDLAKAFV